MAKRSHRGKPPASSLATARPLLFSAPSLKALLRALQIFLLLVLAAGTFLLRCHNRAETFIDGRIYFFDADCYSRMTRVQMVAGQPGLIVHHHDFENFPQGIHSHATAPFDYLILGLKRVFDLLLSGRAWATGSHLVEQTLDLAGAFVSPALGAATSVFLALWGWWLTDSLRFESRVLRACAASGPALLSALSPILVHGTVLGRPDHQSLLILLLAVALGAEAMLARVVTRRWAITAGLSWGMALWVSFYEPLVLLGVVLLLLALLDRPGLLHRARLWEAGAMAALVLVSLLVEGWPLGGLQPEVVQFFPAWSRTVGELHTVSLGNSIFCQWVGFLFYASPVLLLLARRIDRRALAALLLLLITVGLTCWQLRWSYFFALVFAMTLSWQLAALRRWWVAAPVLLLSLFGTATLWEATLFPEGDAEDELNARIRERVLLREIGDRLDGPFLAPWWESPPLAYWSGQCAVAGSSHESLSGIVDTARFYVDVNDAHAGEILRRREVLYVISDETARLLTPALGLLGGEPSPDMLAYRLNEDPYTAEPYLKPIHVNLFFKIFAVDRAKLNP